MTLRVGMSIFGAGGPVTGTMAGEGTTPLLLVVGTGDSGLGGVSIFTSGSAGGIGTGSTIVVGTLTTGGLIVSRFTKFVVAATTKGIEHRCDRRWIFLRRDMDGCLPLGRGWEWRNAQSDLRQPVADLSK